MTSESRSPTTVIRARVVLPVCAPPIENGAVGVEAGRICAVGRAGDLTPGEANVVDLGEAVLVPGLINAHAHLDYTRMAGRIPPPRSFVQWIQALLALKSEWSYTDYADSWLSGARTLLERGVTTVADIEAVPELLPEVWQATPLRVFSFLEMTGVRRRRAAEQIIAETVGHIERLPRGRGAIGLSPHAPYSTTPGLLALSRGVALERGWRRVTHVAESEEEFEMYRHARGPLYDWLKRNDRAVDDCGHGSPVRWLGEMGYLDDALLAVHVNYLDDGDAAILARHGVHVVHCPRSHAYFGHQPFPWSALHDAGVNVAVGTDSLVTTRADQGRAPALDLLEELRVLAGTIPELAPAELLAMATVHGARALGWGGQLGQLSAGARADMVVFPFAGAGAAATEAVLAHRGPVLASMIDGRWVHGP